MNKDPLSLAQIVGYCAMCLSVSSFGFKSNRTMNMILVVTNILLVIHFGLLGALAGLANQGVSILRSLIFVIQKNPQRHIGFFILFMILYTILGVISFKQSYDILPLLASYCTCFALYIFSGIRTKLAFIIANVFLFSYSYIVFSIGGMISMLVGIILGLFTIWRIAKVKPVPPA